MIKRQELSEELKNELDKINVLTALPITTGVANTYSVTIAGLLNLTPGLKVTIKFHQASNGASTLNVNEFGAINIIKPGGGSPNLKAGIYTLVYDGVNFQLQGEGGEYGTALASDVVTGKTIGTENGIITGTMPNRGALNQTITTNNGQVNISSGYYTGGIIKAMFANLVASNVRAGVDIGGVVGTLKSINNAILSLHKYKTRDDLTIHTHHIMLPAGQRLKSWTIATHFASSNYSEYRYGSDYFSSPSGTFKINPYNQNNLDNMHSFTLSTSIEGDVQIASIRSTRADGSTLTGAEVTVSLLVIT